ncbi:hypothetical protein AAE478_002266 [Parahypoxylon ruwenzoriense]
MARRRGLASRKRTEDWDQLKPVLEELYINKKMPLPDVSALMLQDYKFKATPKQYRYRFEKWEWVKYNKRSVLSYPDLDPGKEPSGDGYTSESSEESNQDDDMDMDIDDATMTPETSDDGEAVEDKMIRPSCQQFLELFSSGCYPIDPGLKKKAWALYSNMNNVKRSKDKGEFVQSLYENLCPMSANVNVVAWHHLNYALEYIEGERQALEAGSVIGQGRPDDGPAITRGNAIQHWLSHRSNEENSLAYSCVSSCLLWAKKQLEERPRKRSLLFRFDTLGEQAGADNGLTMANPHIRLFVYLFDIWTRDIVPSDNDDWKKRSMSALGISPAATLCTMSSLLLGATTADSGPQSLAHQPEVNPYDGEDHNALLDLAMDRIGYLDQIPLGDLTQEFIAEFAWNHNPKHGLREDALMVSRRTAEQYVRERLRSWPFDVTDDDDSEWDLD